MSLDGINLPAAGFIAAAKRAGHELVPAALVLRHAAPARSTHEAYERIAGELLERPRRRRSRRRALSRPPRRDGRRPSADDGEGELLRRVCGVWWDRICRSSPASISTPMSRRRWSSRRRRSVAYRTYPHVDMADDGRARRGAAPAHPAPAARSPRRFASSSFLIPLHLAMHHGRSGGRALSRGRGRRARRGGEPLLRPRLPAGRHRRIAARRCWPMARASARPTAPPIVWPRRWPRRSRISPAASMSPTRRCARPCGSPPAPGGR